MPTKTNSEAEQRLEKVASEVLHDSDSVERVETLDTSDELLIEVGCEYKTNSNTFAGCRLGQFIEHGFIPTSVAASQRGAIAWFKPTNINISLRD